METFDHQGQDEQRLFIRPGLQIAPPLNLSCSLRCASLPSRSRRGGSSSGEADRLPACLPGSPGWRQPIEEFNHFPDDLREQFLNHGYGRGTPLHLIKSVVVSYSKRCIGGVIEGDLNPGASGTSFVDRGLDQRRCSIDLTHLYPRCC